MDLKPVLERARRSMGIESLLPMQEDMAHISLPARVLLQAPTGSGKTLAFAILLMRSIKTKPSGIKAVVIAPTRELVLQIYDTLRPLAAPDFKTTALYGGHSFEIESKSLSGNPDIVVGTPGRILDHINRHRLDLAAASTLVIDEYDKALELGFTADMKRIVATIKHVSTLALTSATSADIPDFVGNVEHVFDYRGEKDDDALSAPTVYEVESDAADKLDTLIELLRTLGGRKTIVFVNHREAAERVYAGLQKNKISACLYHGGLEQDVRDRALILFANGTAPVMVATDLAARGLDIEGMEAVIHYHLPVSAEAWTHRNGRTGRLGGINGDVYVVTSPKDRLPEYIDALPIDKAEISPHAYEPKATLYFNAGKKQKISRGDIAGFLITKGGLSAGEVGRIDVRDNCAYVAVPAQKARSVIEAVAPYKIKNTKVRVSRIKNI